MDFKTKNYTYDYSLFVYYGNVMCIRMRELTIKTPYN